MKGSDSSSSSENSQDFGDSNENNLFSPPSSFEGNRTINEAKESTKLFLDRKVASTNSHKIGLYLQTEKCLQENEIFTEDNFTTGKLKSFNGQPIQNQKSEESLKGKKLRQVLEINNFIILPDDSIKTYWDVVIAILLVYTTVVTPFLIAFYELETLGWSILDTTIDVLFGIEIILNFLSAYYDAEENLIIDRRKLAITFIKGWFCIDFISVIPVSLLMQSGKDYNSLARIARLPRLYRLIKMTKLVRMLKVVKERNVLVKYLNELFKVTAGIERIIYIIFVFIILCHITACLWFFMARLDNFEPNTWVFRYGYLDSSIFDCYLTGFYWTVTTITTVGFGDISPGTTNEKIFGIIIMCIGVCAYSFAIGSLSSVLSNLDSKQAKLKEKLGMLDEMRKHYHLDTNFYMKLRGALKYDYRMKDTDKYDFLNELPPQLKQELSFIIHHQLVKQVPFFSNLPQKFIAHVTQYFKPIKISKNEYVFQEGDLAGEIYFLTKGSVQLVLPQFDDLPYFQFKQGNYFGELDLIHSDEEKGVVRKFTAKAVEDSEFYVLSEKDFKQLVIDYSNIIKKLFDYAELKIEKLEEIRKRVISQCQNENSQPKAPHKLISTNQLQTNFQSMPVSETSFANFNSINDFNSKLILQMRNKIESLKHNIQSFISTLPSSSIPTIKRDNTQSSRSYSLVSNQELWNQI